MIVHFLLAISLLGIRISGFNDFISIQECLKSGFKNTVFTLLDNRLLLRVAFVTDSMSVISFRTIERIDIFKAALHSWRDNADQFSVERYILDSLVKCDALITERDLVTFQDLFREYFFGAISNTISKLFFGTSGAVQRNFFPLPQSQQINASVSLVLDFHVQLSGDLLSFNRTMTELELVHFLYAYYSGQHSFYKHAGTFHVDGHAGNVLYQLSGDDYYFVWTDFGKTSATSKEGQQFQNSLISIHNEIMKRAQKSGYNRIIEILHELKEVSSGYSPDYIMFPLNFLSLLNIISQSIISKYHSDEIEQILNRLSPSLSFGFSHLHERISNLESSNAAKTEQINELTGAVEELTGAVEELASADAVKSLRIEELASADAVKSLRIEDLERKLDNLINLITSSNNSTNEQVIAWK